MSDTTQNNQITVDAASSMSVDVAISPIIDSTIINSLTSLISPKPIKKSYPNYPAPVPGLTTLQEVKEVQELPVLIPVINTTNNTTQVTPDISNTSNTTSISNTNTLLTNLEDLTKYVYTTLDSSGKITMLNIIIILTNLMHIVEQYKTLTGSQKKMLVIDTLKKVINEQYGNSPDEYTEKQMLLILINSSLPSIIDTLVSSINGEIKFKKSNNTNNSSNSKFLSSFKKLFCCN
jgi:hypothetical protein